MPNRKESERKKEAGWFSMRLKMTMYLGGEPTLSNTTKIKPRLLLKSNRAMIPIPTYLINKLLKKVSSSKGIKCKPSKIKPLGKELPPLNPLHSIIHLKIIIILIPNPKKSPKLKIIKLKKCPNLKMKDKKYQLSVILIYKHIYFY